MADPWGGLNSGGGWGGLNQNMGDMSWGAAPGASSPAPQGPGTPMMGSGMHMGGMGGMMGGGMMRRRRPNMMGGFGDRWGGLNPSAQHMSPWEVEASGLGGAYPGGIGNNGSYGPSTTPINLPRYPSDPNASPGTASFAPPGVPGAGNYNGQADTTAMGMLFNMTDPGLFRYGNPALDFRDGGPVAQQLGQYATTPLSQVPMGDMSGLMSMIDKMIKGFGTAKRYDPGRDPATNPTLSMNDGSADYAALMKGVMG